jgi:hypothetical protein
MAVAMTQGRCISARAQERYEARLGVVGRPVPSREALLRKPRSVPSHREGRSGR